MFMCQRTPTHFLIISTYYFPVVVPIVCLNNNAKQKQKCSLKTVSETSFLFSFSIRINTYMNLFRSYVTVIDNVFVLFY